MTNNAPRQETKNHILHDAGIIGASILAAAWLQSSGVIDSVVGSTGGLHWLESLFAGVFFTSAFTTAPAIILLGNLAQAGSAIETAFFGGLGAVAGDLIIFRFFRDALAEDFFVLAGRAQKGRILHIFRLRIFRWFTPFIAGLIMASPLPDEAALMLMGFSKTNTRLVLMFSFVANVLGILAIGLAARALE
jgi:hypothetical protein